MLSMLGHIRDRLERFLKIDASQGVSTQARARIVYATGLIFIGVQLLNLISMTLVYGSWTGQHWISVLSCAVFAGVTFLLRWTKSPTVFGSIYAALCLSSIWFAATIQTVPELPPQGISTTLLPVLVGTAALIAFIGTHRVSMLNILSSLVLIALLFRVSANTGITGLEAIITWQRAVQAVVGLMLVGPICTVIAGIVFRNLDHLEVAVQRAKFAESARADFLATMSHEIRTPLHGIMGLSDMLSRSELPLPQSRYADLISTSSTSLMEIIDEVLDMARLEDGDIKIAAEPFDPRSLLQDVCDLFAIKASEKKLWIGAKIADDVPEQLVGDAPHLRQILNNLVGNALKFTQTGGVRVGARCVASDAEQVSIQFYVQDTGVGISAEEQKTVFDRFSQTASSNVTKTKGTGLGLAICQQLTEMMGGTLSLSSESGKGTVFHFTLTLPTRAYDDLDLLKVA